MSSGFGPPKAFIIPFAIVGSLVIIGAIITALHRCGHTFGFSSFERRIGGHVGPTRFEVDRPGGLNGTVLPGPFYPPALTSNAPMSGVPNSIFQSQGYNYQTSVPQAQPPPQSYYPVQQYQPPSPNPLLALNPLLQNQPRGRGSAPVQTPMSTAPTITPFVPTRPSSRATARDFADLEAARGSYCPSAYGMGGSGGADAYRAGGLPPSYESTWEESPRR